MAYGLFVKLAVFCYYISLSLACHRLPSNVKVFEGGTADFSCTVSNYSDNSEGRWTIYKPDTGAKYDIIGKANRDIQLPPYIISDSPHGRYSLTYKQAEAHEYGLHIMNVTNADGLFKFACSLWNKTGPVIQSDQLDLTVLPLPQVQCSTGKVILPDMSIPSSGFRIDLVCWMTGNGPPVPLVWFGNGIQLGPPQNGTNYLYYLLTPSDRGKVFSCHADIDTEREVPSCSVIPLLPTNDPTTTTPSLTYRMTSKTDRLITQANEEVRRTTTENFQNIASVTSKSGNVITDSESPTTQTSINQISNTTNNQSYTDHHAAKRMIIIIVALVIIVVFVANVVGFLCSKTCFKKVKSRIAKRRHESQTTQFCEETADNGYAEMKGVSFEDNQGYDSYKYPRPVKGVPSDEAETYMYPETIIGVPMDETGPYNMYQGPYQVPSMKGVSSDKTGPYVFPKPILPPRKLKAPSNVYDYICTDEVKFTKNTDSMDSDYQVTFNQFEHDKKGYLVPDRDAVQSNFYEDIPNVGVGEKRTENCTSHVLKNFSQNTYQMLQSDEARKEQSDPSFYTSLQS